MFEVELTAIAQERHARRNSEDLTEPAFMERFAQFDEIVESLREDFPTIKEGQDWQDIEHYREVRHAMVHHESRIVILDKKHKAELAKMPQSKRKRRIEHDVSRSHKIQRYIETRVKSGKTGIELHGEVIKISPEFCREAASEFYGFLRKVV